MKKINIPIERTFSTQAIDFHQAQQDLVSGKKKVVAFSTIDFSSGKDLDQANMNGGLIIWSTICLEKKLDSIITDYIFQEAEQSRKSVGKRFFSENIIQADHFSFAVKKGLVIDIVHENSLLKGKDKDRLTTLFKKIMDFRNMFAHGDISHEANAGVVLRYWSGGRKKVVLSDDYWGKLEECFIKGHKLVDEIKNKI